MHAIEFDRGDACVGRNLFLFLMFVKCVSSARLETRIKESTKWARVRVENPQLAMKVITKV